MADISKITLPTGSTYNIKDAQARTDIQTLQGAVTGGMHYIGVTTTALTDGASTNPIVIGGNNVTAKAGDLAIYEALEFIYSDTDSKWHEFGSTGSLKSLAFKDSASGSVTPSGSVSQPTFTGSSLTATGNYTPEGSVSVSPTVTLNTTTVNSITAVGTLPSCTLPSLSTSVASETLTIGWTAGSFSAGTLPTKGSNTTVATSVNSATATGTFTGTQKAVSVSGTPSGTVSKPSFTGTATTVTVS